MTAAPGPCYRFAKPAQLLLLHKAGLAETLIIDPSSALDAGSITGCGARAIAVDAGGDLFWVDGQGRLSGAGCAAFPTDVGCSSNEAVRIVAGRKRLWVLCRGADDGLVQFDIDTLHRLIDLEAGKVIDIAPDGRDGLWLLEGKSVAHISSRGRRDRDGFGLKESAIQIGAVGGVIGALTTNGMCLLIHHADTGRTLSVELHDALGEGANWVDVSLSAAAGAFLLAGTIETAGSSEPRFVLVDTHGNIIVHGRWRDNLGPKLVVLAGGDLLALFEDGPDSWKLRRFQNIVRRGSHRIVTPALDTEVPEGRWLRADLTATLPEGATLEMRWAATSDQGLRRTVDNILADQKLTESARLAFLDELLPWTKPFTYLGEASDASEQAMPAQETFALPLHDAEGSTLWVDAQLRSHGAPDGPIFTALTIFHEAESLMDHLPAVYRHKGDGDRTLRRLVGVLEATTQDIDQRIGRLAERLDPKRTPQHWLPDLAQMLGLPFHDALSEDMQRALVGAAPAILAGRGTRRGLLAMLQALFPDRPIQVTDRTEQLIPVALNKSGRLPALLAGPSARIPKLNARLILKRTALCPASACTDSLVAPSSEVLVVVPATRGERRRYGDALRAMIAAMLPAGIGLRLQWETWAGATGELPEAVLTILDSPMPVSLGDGPALGRGRAGGRMDARLDRGGTVPSGHRIL